MNKRLFVLHPFLFALFPVLSLYANNLGEIPFAAVIRAMAIALAWTGLVLVLLRLALKNWQRAGLVTTMASLLFFTYGHVYRWAGHALGIPPIPLALVWLALLGVGVWLVLTRLRRMPLELTHILNITGGIALATCLYSFGAYGFHLLRVGEVRTVSAAADEPAVHATPSATPGPRISRPPADPFTNLIIPLPVVTQPSIGVKPPAPPPDIYYIILDAHGRSDVINELYGVDNSHFINFLRVHGFYVAPASHSNYAQTALSLSSSLNFNYLDAKMELLPEAKDRGVLTGLINDNDTARFLRDQGYRTVAFNNGFPATEMDKADTFIQDPEGLNNFEMTLLSGSLGQEELDPQLLDSYRQRITWSESELEKLVEDRSDTGPKFVFAHFILPHPPFVFNADGSPRVSLDGGDGSAYTGTREDYWQGYREQVQYTDTLAEQMILTILRHSLQPPVIIIQGDHGSGLDLDWASQANSCMRERFSILNAYYIPSKKGMASLYPTITPVNSFRVVLNTYFNAKLPLLPDRSFFSLWDTPYQMNDVTHQMEATCPSKRAGE